MCLCQFFWARPIFGHSEESKISLCLQNFVASEIGRLPKKKMFVFVPLRNENLHTIFFGVFLWVCLLLFFSGMFYLFFCILGGTFKEKFVFVLLFIFRPWQVEWGPCKLPMVPGWTARTRFSDMTVLVGIWFI